MQGDIIRIKTQGIGHRFSEPQRILTAHPEFTLAIFDHSGGIHRLHTGMSQIGHLVIRADDLGCAGHGSGDIALKYIGPSLHRCIYITLKLFKDRVAGHLIIIRP